MAKYQVDNIEVNLKATAKEALQAFDQAISKGKELEKVLQSINTLTRKSTSNAKNLQKAFKTVSMNKTTVKNLQQTEKAVKNTTNQTEKLAKTMNNAFNVAKIAYFARTMYRIGKEMINSSAEFGENYNLFNVAMDESIDKGMEFQEQLSGILHMNISDTMRYQGFFKSLSESLGIAEEGAYKLSENLTKLTYDLSSLYNKKFDTMYIKLQSAMVGQTKPLREVGIDVSQQTLQGYLDNMGIDQNVIKLTQAEKVLLRYIAILDQSKIAHGDFAKTIESPANQMKTFTELVKQLYIWLGNVFIGMFGKIMPYINGFTMVLVEMAKTLAYVFGFDLSKYEYADWNGVSEDVLDLTEGLDDVGASADSAGNKIKKMQGLLGFNEINNIKTPEDPASGGVGGIGGGSGSVYDELLAQVKDYDNLMSNVRTKASDIRNAIFDWLGFTYDINALTGEISNLKWGGFFEMSTGAKMLVIALGALVGLKVAGTVSGLIDSFGKIKGVLVGSGSASASGGLVGALGKLGGAFTKVTTFGGQFVSSVKAWGLKSTLSALLTPITTFLGSIGGFFGATGTLATVLGGGAIVAGILAIVGAVEAFKWGIQDSIKEVDVFNGVSKETREILEPLNDSFTTLDNTITELEWGKEIIDENDVKNVKTQLGNITTYIKSNFITKIEKSKQTISDTNMFEGLDISKRTEIIERLDKHLATQQQKIDEAEKEIYTIMETASLEKRDLKKEEVDRINQLQTLMKETAIKELSASQQEQEAILTNLKLNTERLEAERAVEIIAKAKELKEKTIFEASDRYNKEIAEANRLKELGVISEEEYKVMTDNAKKNYDKQVSDANKAYTNIVNEAKRGMGNLADSIDWDKGKIKSNWQKMTDGIKNMWSNVMDWFGKNRIKPKFDSSELRISTEFDKANQHGSIKIQAFATGGFPEDGLFFANSNELVGSFSNGRTAVANNGQIIEGIKQGVIEAMLAVNGGSQGNVVVPIYMDSREIAKHTINRNLEMQMVRG